MAMEIDKSKGQGMPLKAFLEAHPWNLEQFEHFLAKQGYKNDLEFVWAVQGMKGDEECLHIDRIIFTLHKHYFERIHISQSVKLNVTSKIGRKEYSSDIFDEAVEQVWRFLECVVYKQFLVYYASIPDIYKPPPAEPVPAPVPVAPFPFERASSIGTGSSSSFSSNPSIGHRNVPSTSVAAANLEPLIEGQEFQNQNQSLSNCSNTAILGLTRDALKATLMFRSQSDSDLVPASSSKQNPYHTNYISYNPVSRQDSEVQSASSGCLTDTDSITRTKKRKEPKAAGSSSKPDVNSGDSLPNKNPLAQTQCIEKLAGTDVQKFAADLTKRLNEWLSAPDPQITISKRRKLIKEPSAISESLAQIFNNQLGFDESPPDNILEKHVKRVWSDDTPPLSSLSISPTGRREHKKCKPSIRSRVHSHTKEPKNQLPKSRSFPSTSELSQDSGISIATTSTATSSTSTSAAQQDYTTAKINYGIL